MKQMQNELQDYINAIEHIDTGALECISSALIEARVAEQNIFICGNGGSAATALHMTTDFLKTYDITLQPMKVMCLNANISSYSAIANDYSHSQVFRYQLQHFLKADDIVIIISASGNSLNCIEALQFSREKKAKVIGMTGFQGGKIAKKSDLLFHVPYNDYFIVESVHVIASHLVTTRLREV